MKKNQYKGHLKMRERQKSRDQSSYFSGTGKKTKRVYPPFRTAGSASRKACWEAAPRLVQRPLEDESDEALLAAQLLGAEGAGGVEGVRAVRQRDLTPEGPPSSPSRRGRRG